MALILFKDQPACSRNLHYVRRTPGDIERQIVFAPSQTIYRMRKRAIDREVFGKCIQISIIVNIISLYICLREGLHVAVECVAGLLFIFKWVESGGEMCRVVFMGCECVVLELLLQMLWSKATIFIVQMSIVNGLK